MSYIGSNLVPILAATVAGLLIGIVYLAMSEPHWDKGGARSIGLLALAFISEFWLTSILAGALILAPVQANAWTIALGSAVVIWIGFILPAFLVSYSVRGLRASALLLDCAHWLAVMIAQAAVLNWIGLVRP